jgi:hypothetical protein
MRKGKLMIKVPIRRTERPVQPPFPQPVIYQSNAPAWLNPFLSALAAAIFMLILSSIGRPLEAREAEQMMELVGGGGRTTGQVRSQFEDNNVLGLLVAASTTNEFRRQIELTPIGRRRRPEIVSGSGRLSFFETSDYVDGGFSFTTTSLFARRLPVQDRDRYYGYLLLTRRPFLFDTPELQYLEYLYFTKKTSARTIDAAPRFSLDLVIHSHGSRSIVQPFWRFAFPIPLENAALQNLVLGSSIGVRIGAPRSLMFTLEGYVDGFYVKDDSADGALRGAVDAGGRAGIAVYF